MKRILALLLCIVMAAAMLVSCGEDEIGKYLKDGNYEGLVADSTKKKVDLTMYLPTEADTTPNAAVTVARQIEAVCSLRYNTLLHVYFLQEKTGVSGNYEKDKAAPLYYVNDYETGLNALLADKGGDIVLVTNKAYADSIKSSVIDLAAYFAGNDFGKLNTVITPTLLTAVTEKGEGSADKIYFVPNNHVVGQYRYAVIDPVIVTDGMSYAPGTVKAMTTETEISALIGEVKDFLDLGGTYESAAVNAALQKYNSGDPSSIDQFIRFEDGGYADIAAYLADGYYCNVIEMPTVKISEAYSSAFAIRSACANPDRAMEIIYQLNVSTELRNLVQYGVVNTNYTLSANTVTRKAKGDADGYFMNILYTGDLFCAYFCDDPDLGWQGTADAQGGRTQNAAAKLKQE